MLNDHRRFINLRQAQEIQRRFLLARQQRMAEYMRRQLAGEDTSDLNIDNDFDMSDQPAKKTQLPGSPLPNPFIYLTDDPEGEIQDWEGGQE